jgi:hypothetical protein
MQEAVKAIDLVDFGARSTHATFFKKGGENWDNLVEFDDHNLEYVVTQISVDLKMDQDKARLLLKKTVILRASSHARYTPSLSYFSLTASIHTLIHCSLSHSLLH